MKNVENKIVTYLIFTATMVITFICAIAINKDYYSIFAWIVLLLLNLSFLVYLSRK